MRVYFSILTLEPFIALKLSGMWVEPASIITFLPLSTVAPLMVTVPGVVSAEFA
jgi:hypothetical protein